MASRKQKPPEEDAGAPEWMVTFSDCMTLLLTFFVLLLSFSSFDNKIFHEIRDTFYLGMESLGMDHRRNRFSNVEIPEFLITKEPVQGSETRTFEEPHQGNIEEQQGLFDFYNNKILVIPSEEIFWGTGTNISPKGLQFLESLGSFLNIIPSKIIINETWRGNLGATDAIGMARSWKIFDHLQTKADIDRARLNLSAMSCDTKNNLSPVNQSRKNKNHRNLEIVLLERRNF